MKLKEKQRMQQAFVDTMDYDEMMNCTRCGFCLPSCPTYIESGKDEKQSPRGRIALMKGLVDGVIEPSEDMKRSIDLCLGCRACETACPSGVNFGHLLEQARSAINQSSDKGFLEKTTRTVVFDQMFPKQKRMQQATSLLYLYQSSGLDKGVRSLGLLNFLPDTLKNMEKVLPKVPKQKHNTPKSSKSSIASKKKVAFFSGCLMDTMFKETNRSTIKLLEYAGCEVTIPENQNCCGALHGHSGEMEKAKEMAKNNIRSFEAGDYDYIITNAGGCGAFLHDYDHLLKDDAEWAGRADEFSSRIKDISSILGELDFYSKPLELEDQVVTYQDSCHLRNVQKTFEEPRKLLQSIKGIQYAEMKNAQGCCGSAGIYNILESEMSMQILDHKMENVKDTMAKTIVTANPGCLLQMKLGIEREGLSGQMRAVHIVDLLVEACDKAEERQTTAV